MAVQLLDDVKKLIQMVHIVDSKEYPADVQENALELILKQVSKLCSN